MFIYGSSAISPQLVFGIQYPILGFYRENRLKAMEPDYSTLIDPKLIRRMSRVIRMGVATAKDALQQAGVQNPDAILTGTAYGCLEDTGVFLKRLVENQEEMLTPTAFIQSTHNTVGAQVALLLNCHAYNSTVVQRSVSFERALQDAQLCLAERPGDRILVGAADELTDYSYAILSRFGLFRHQSAGEGAAYFVVGSEHLPTAIARITRVTTLFQPDEQEWSDCLADLKAQHAGGEYDLLLSGEGKNDPNANHYAKVREMLGEEITDFRYKIYCGDYPTSTAFATWLAAFWVREGMVCGYPLVLLTSKILIYQADAFGHHSFIEVQAC